MNGFMIFSIEGSEEHCLPNVLNWFGCLVLLENGADPNKVSTIEGLTPLYISSGKGFVQFVKLLLDNKANVIRSFSLKKDSEIPLFFR